MVQSKEQKIDLKAKNPSSYYHFKNNQQIVEP
jgi:hypothetical protein